MVTNESIPLRDNFAQKLADKFIKKGNTLVNNLEEINFVFNLTSIENPRIFRRKSKSIFVISIVTGDIEQEDIRSAAYTTLIRTLSNLLIYIKPKNSKKDSTNLENCTVYFTTPEAGFYSSDYDLNNIYEKTLPIAGAHFSTDNKFDIDLPKSSWYTTSIVESIKEYGQVLNNLGILPTPFPLRDVLTEDQLTHLYKIFGITGASYGNLSARERFPELGDSTFWMTGRGVDKSNLSEIGKDILLVKKFNFNTGQAILSVPPHYFPKARVSVDAVEHALIYERFPEVGAIVHVHAWMDDIVCTNQNYPCGTTELAREVAELLSQCNNPSQAVVGLKNHGLTITGYSLDDIFERISGKLKTEVEMYV